MTGFQGAFIIGLLVFIALTLVHIRDLLQERLPPRKED